MNVFEIIQKSWLLYKASFRQIFPLAFIMALVSQLALWAANININQTGDNFNVQSWPILIGAIVGMWLVTLMGNAMIQICQNAKLYQYSVNFLQAGTYTLQRLPSLILAASLFSIMVSAGLFLYVIPGVILMTLLALYSPIILFLQKQGISALQYSFQLVRQQFFASFTVLALNLALLLLPQLFSSMLNYNFNDDFGVEEALGVLATSLLIPFSNALILVLFYKLNALYKNKSKTD
ncbi:MAG: hypothetical protein K0S29_1246 [Gammaproteobacteria bacterium]|jgi:hypothetical protein|nr:hypothetical protein [Gammaproteobacteria bacterium]